MRERIEFPEPGELEIVNRQPPSVPPEQYRPYDPQFGDVPPLAAFGSGYRFHVTGLNKAADGFPTTRADLVDAEERRQLRKIEANRAAIEKNEEYRVEDADVLIFAYGTISRSARSAVDSLRNEGIKAGLFRPITLWPFPEHRMAVLAGRVRAIVVPEMNLGQMILEIERVIHGACAVSGIGRVDGEPITPAQIATKVKEVL